MIKLIAFLLLSHINAFNVYRTDSGIPIHQPYSPIIYWLGDIYPDNLNITKTIEAIEQSFDEWVSLDCMDFQIIKKGPISSCAAQFDPSGNNQNVIVFIIDKQKWLHDPDYLALTSLNFDSETGKIMDADIELNAAYFTYTLNQPDNNQVFFKNTLVHEIGHFFGMAHSDDPEASMYKKSPLKETKKATINEDDKKGICWLYALYPPQPVTKKSKDVETYQDTIDTISKSDINSIDYDNINDIIDEPIEKNINNGSSNCSINLSHNSSSDYSFILVILLLFLVLLVKKRRII